MLPACPAVVIAKSASDEAIQSGASDWIASRHFVALAMTSRSRDAFQHPSYENERISSGEWKSIRNSQCTK